MDNKLKEQVIIEANNLKKHATKEELNKLDFNYLKPSNIKRCVYGQMTGDCFNQRAWNLIKECTSIFYPILDQYSSDAVIQRIGGFLHERNCSPIEVYIVQTGANHEALIDYLKGKRDSLTIKDL